MICHECGRRIEGAAVARDYHGFMVSLHVKCSKRVRPEVTARATTSESGRTYVDDRQYADINGPYRLVHPKAGDRS